MAAAAASSGVRGAARAGSQKDVADAAMPRASSASAAARSEEKNAR
jgi:hypothetical protein